MSFTRQIFIFIGIWGLLIYIFLTKLNTSGAERSEESQKLLNVLSSVEESKKIDLELRQLLNEFTNEGLSNDARVDYIRKINKRFQESSADNAVVSYQAGVPSAEYEHYRRRTRNNLGEFWNYVSSEAEKIEKLVKSEDSQQALKELSSFLKLAVEHKR
jgi:hypothetical protein